MPLLSHPKICVLDEDFVAGLILERGIDLMYEPLDEKGVTTNSCAVVAEDIQAEVFEMLTCKGYVAKDVFTCLPLYATEQADALKETRHVGGLHAGGYAFVPLCTQGGIEGFYSAAELDLCGCKLFGKFGKAVAIEIVGLEPKGVDVLLAHHLLEQGKGSCIELHGGAGVDYVEHTIVARHILQDSSIDGIGVLRGIEVIVAKSASAPTAPSALQEHEFARQNGVDKGIAFHQLVSNRQTTAQGMHGGIGHGGTEECLENEFGRILEGYHIKKVVCGDHPIERNKHKREAVEPVGYGRTANGAHPEAAAAHLLFNLLHEPGIGELAKQKAYQ